MSTEERLPPNYEKLDVALRSIGYSFPVAVADIVDNSIDARARTVLVRLLTMRGGSLGLCIGDDGDGMSKGTLREAMRFGASVSQEVKRLGKFGLGLKLASLSQAREVHVVSLKNGVMSGRAWLEQGIKRGFSSTSYEKAECMRLATRLVPDWPSRSSGTLVWWSDLYRVGRYHGGLEEHAQKLLHSLENYLALAFHRFLSGRSRRVRVTLDIFDEKTGKRGIPVRLAPLDPFAYGNQSGHKSFPAQLLLDGRYRDLLTIKAHIWPPNSVAPEYKLPGGANSRQGFYFYRNDRLIQGGGWNGIREVEPHSSLARLEVDIDSAVDLAVNLDVKKVEIQLAPDFSSAIQRAKTASGIDFKKYLAIADETYRTRKVTESELPLIPSRGLPAPLVNLLHTELRLEGTAKHRDLKIEWKRLDDETFFAIDPDGGFLYLNSAFRKALLHGLPGSAADVPVVKSLLFLVLEEALLSERLSSRMREYVEMVNRILAKAVDYERS